MIHPSKRVQGCKEDRRFVYKETFLDLNEWSYYRIEKEEDRLKWVIYVIRQEVVASGATAANSVSFPVKQKRYKVEMGGTDEATEKLFNQRQKRLYLGFEQKRSEEEKAAFRQDGQLMSSFLNCDCMAKCTHRQQVWFC